MRLVGGVAQLFQFAVNILHFHRDGALFAQIVQRLNGFGVRHIGRVFAGEGELGQAQRVGAEGRSLARGDQLVGGGDRVGDVAYDLDQQVIGQGGLLGPILDVGAEFQRVVRLRMAPAVVDALVIDALVKVVVRGRVLDVGQFAGGGQVAAVGCGGGDGACVHQGHGADLPLAGLGALAVGEVAGRMADGKFAVGRGVARAEAGAAEALTEDAARGNNIRYSAIFHQLQVGGHAVRINTELERAVAAALALYDIGHRTDVLVRAAGAARDDALLDIDAAIGADLAHQIHMYLAAQLLVGLILGRLQNFFGVGFQLADGVGVARVHRQRDHALNSGEVQLDAAVVVGNIGGFQLFVGFGAVVLLEILLRHSVGLPDGRPAGGLGGHDIDAVAIVGGKVGNARADELHDLVFHVAVGIGGCHQRQRDVVRADAGVRLAGQVDGYHAGVGHIVGAAHQLFGQLAAALAHGHGAQGTVAGVGVGAQDHTAAAGHHFPVIAVDDGHVRRDIDAAVFVCGGEGKLMVVLVDGAADRAQAVVAVGHDVGQRKFFHAGGAGRLDDAHVGDIVAGHRVELHPQVLHGIAGIMCF